MADEINKKVINIFCKYKQDMPSDHKEAIKSYAGYKYVKINRDHNGKKFNQEYLKKYAKKCHYIVRVMRHLGEDVVLYNYDVASDELFKILQEFETGKLDGMIIEIDKYFPEDLA